MKAAPTLAKRRKMAIELAPMIEACHLAYREHGFRFGSDEELISLRADQIFRLALAGFQGPCAWSRDECRKAMCSAMPSATEDIT